MLSSLHCPFGWSSSVACVQVRYCFSYLFASQNGTLQPLHCVNTEKISSVQPCRCYLQTGEVDFHSMHFLRGLKSRTSL